MAIEIININMKPTSRHGQVSILGETSTHRYHMWLTDEFLPTDGTVYKNAKFRTFGDKTMRLTMHRGIGKDVAKQLLAFITPETIAQRKAAVEELHKQEHVERCKIMTAKIKRDNAEELFAALEEIVKNDPYKRSSAGIIARKALDKATWIETPTV